jgi:hypothetical protein
LGCIGHRCGHFKRTAVLEAAGDVGGANFGSSRIVDAGYSAAPQHPGFAGSAWRLLATVKSYWISQSQTFGYQTPTSFLGQQY